MDCIRNSYRINNSGYANHRQVYEREKGPIPDGLVVMHTCSNRWCVNPDHLTLGTQHQNRMEQVTRGANPKQKISFEDAELIRWCGAQGRTKYGWATEVARLFGVDKSTITRIRKGQAFQEALQ